MANRFKHGAPDPVHGRALVNELQDLAAEVGIALHEVAGGAVVDVEAVQQRIRRLAFGIREQIESQAERMAALDRAQVNRAHEMERVRRVTLEGIVAEAAGEGFEPHGFFVYLLWGDDPDKPLYVGQSRNVLSRLGTHMSSREKRSRVRRVQLLRCRSAREMDRTEWALIKQYQPPMNVIGIEAVTSNAG